jgi:hypothetical protein
MTDTITASGAVIHSALFHGRVQSGNDDSSTGKVPIGFPIHFGDKYYTHVYINTNGNVTFTGPLYMYTPFSMVTTKLPIIAPFLADVDTSAQSSGRVRYGPTAFEGRPALCISWINVGYHAGHTDKLNIFQLLLVDRSDIEFADFDIVMNYDRILWDSGDAGGGSGGLNGRAAGAGFSSGGDKAKAYFQFPGALTHGALLDSSTGKASNGKRLALIHSRRNSPIWGRHIFRLRDGRLEDEQPIPGTGKWVLTPSLPVARSKVQPVLVKLLTGEVLAVGGFNVHTDVFIPGENKWRQTADMDDNYRGHTATLLEKAGKTYHGLVLVAGGGDGNSDDRALLYDPVANTWTHTKPMKVPRRHHTATRLSNGCVLVVGGRDTAGTPISSAEVFDPDKMEWTLLQSSMATGRSGHTETLIAENGVDKVLVTGGQDTDIEDQGSAKRIASAEVFIVKEGQWAEGQWESAGTMSTARSYHTATWLPTQKRVLVTGGGADVPKAASAELYNPADKTWTPTASMNSARRRHSAEYLENIERVLVIGGYYGDAGRKAHAELYDPATGTWTPTDPMNYFRYDQGSVVLNDGRVLVLGGFAGNYEEQASSEVYTP